MAECNFKNTEEKIRLLQEHLRKYGDGVPERAILEATSGENLEHWVTECDDDGNLLAGITWINNDWFLCTLHYLATAAEQRGKYLGTKVTTEAAKDAMANPNCLVLAADVTYNNEPSKRIFKKLGFEEKSRFCWGPGEKPADVLHFVKMPPTGDTCK